MILAMALCAGFSSCNKDDDDLEEVDDVCTKMTCAGLMSYCYSVYDINHDGKVSISEALAATSFGWGAGTISNLKGIEYFKNIKDVNIGPYLIVKDLSELSKLRNLKKLQLDYYDSAINEEHWYDVSSARNLFSKLTELETIIIHGIGIEELDLSKCNKINYLNLSGGFKKVILPKNNQLPSSWFSEKHSFEIVYK